MVINCSRVRLTFKCEQSISRDVRKPMTSRPSASEQRKLWLISCLWNHNQFSISHQLDSSINSEYCMWVSNCRTYDLRISSHTLRLPRFSFFFFFFSADNAGTHLHMQGTCFCALKESPGRAFLDLVDALVLVPYYSKNAFLAFAIQFFTFWFFFPLSCSSWYLPHLWFTFGATWFSRWDCISLLTPCRSNERVNLVRWKAGEQLTRMSSSHPWSCD